MWPVGAVAETPARAVRAHGVHAEAGTQRVPPHRGPATGVRPACGVDAVRVGPSTRRRVVHDYGVGDRLGAASVAGGVGAVGGVLRLLGAGAGIERGDVGVDLGAGQVGGADRAALREPAGSFLDREEPAVAHVPHAVAATGRMKPQPGEAFELGRGAAARVRQLDLLELRTGLLMAGFLRGLDPPGLIRGWLAVLDTHPVAECQAEGLYPQRARVVVVAALQVPRAEIARPPEAVSFERRARLGVAALGALDQRAVLAVLDTDP
jgi:hypothetical protein